MSTLPLHDEAGLDQEALAAIAASVQSLRTLGAVLAWGRSATRSGKPLDVVTQDEYTHDVVFELRDDRYLVFDTT